MIFENNYIVELRDINTKLEMTNKALMEIMEDTATLHSEKVGYGFEKVKKTNIAWVVLDWKFQIIRRPHYNEKLKVKTWSSDVNKIFAFRDFIITDENGIEILKATSKWLLVDLERKRPVRLTQDIIDMYECHKDLRSFEDKMTDIRYEKDYFSSENIYSGYYDVKRSDIDGNRHMHNVNYLSAAMEIIPFEEYLKGERDNIRICYKKEIQYGEKIIGKYIREEDKEIVCFMDEEQIIRAIIEMK